MASSATESGGNQDNQLRRLADAIQELADTVNSMESHIKIAHFAAACRLLLITKLGFGPVFFLVDLEIKSKVKDLLNATKTEDTIQSAVQQEIAQGIEGVDKSASRSIVRLKRAIESATVFIEIILANTMGAVSFPEAFNAAYGQVFAQCHGPSNLETFSILRPLLPTLRRVLSALGEDENSLREPLTKYVAASRVVIDHIESVFNLNEASARLLGFI